MTEDNDVVSEERHSVCQFYFSKDIKNGFAHNITLQSKNNNARFEMFAFVVILATVIIIVRVWNMMESEEVDDSKDFSNGSESDFVHTWNHLIDNYGTPLGRTCIKVLYSLYVRFTFLNMSILFLKYVPTGVYMYKFLKNIYTTSRDRLKQKQMELEDLQLQIQIVNTKLCVRDAEFAERAEQLRREAERLNRVRMRVRSIIAADEALRRALDGSTVLDEDLEISVRESPEQDRDFLKELLKGLKYENVMTEQQNASMESGEHAQAATRTPEDSVYSSISDMDVKQDCRVRIVKVTNVYKVAYLKHFIKQKRLRRAHKHALIKKRMESIKKLLEDWQKSLNMVINDKLTILGMESRIGATSQEAMGDYSKPVLRDFSDSDSDLRNSSVDMSYDEYSLNWAQNPYRSYCSNFEDDQEAAARDAPDVEECIELSPVHVPPPRYSHEARCNLLSILPEETTSQIAIEEITADDQEP